MQNGIFLLLGANEGNPLHQLRRTGILLAAGGRILQRSAIYRSAPWGGVAQRDFFNQVVELETRLRPRELLTFVLQTEQTLGRIRKEKWGPRLIDIDILFYNQEIIRLPDLSIPHPAIADRRFTLVPLVEIAPAFIHPETKTTMAELLRACPDPLAVDLFLHS